MINKFIKFIIGGLSNTIISYLIYSFLLFFFNYKTSYFLSLIISVIYIFKINTRIVFKVKLNKYTTIIFFSLYFIQIVFYILLLEVWINNFTINKFFAPILNILILNPTFFVINYLISKKYRH